MKPSHHLIVAALFMPLVGCSDDPPAEDMAECPPVNNPSIEMVEVAPTTAGAGDTLSVTVHGTELGFGGEHGEDEGSHESSEGEMADCAGGHIHVYLDDLMTNPLVMATELAFDIPLPDDATAGDHTLMIRLHNRDHTIYEPQVVEEVTVTIQ